MKAYLIIKFDEDKNRKLIESICSSLEDAGIKTTVMIRDCEYWGKTRFTPKELMDVSFKIIRDTDIVVVEFSKKGVGLGIEAGYAFSKKKPIIVIAKRNSEISDTLKGIASRIIFYTKPSELTSKFKSIREK